MPLDMTNLGNYGFIPADHAQPRFFPVSVSRIYDENGHELPGYQRVRRDDTGETLAIHTDSYRLVSNEEAFTAFEEAIWDSSLDKTGMQIATDYANGGARVFRQYLLPAHQVEVKPGAVVALRLLMFNSYDGSTAFKGMSGAFNFVCANTVVRGKTFGSFSFKHTAGVRAALDMPAAFAGLTRAAEEFEVMAHQFRKWSAIALSPTADRARIEAVLRAIPQSSEELVDHLLAQWLRVLDDPSPNGGATAWSLFNVLTAWATHTEGRVRSARFDREARVAKVLESKAWGELVA